MSEDDIKNYINTLFDRDELTTKTWMFNTKEEYNKHMIKIKKAREWTNKRKV